MKKIEDIILIVLSGLIILSLVFVTGNHFGLLVIPNKQIIDASLFGFLVSGFSMIIFPLWSVGNYLKTSSIKKILDYRIRYKIPYVGLTASFIGLIILSMAEGHEGYSLSSLLFYIIGLSFLLNGFVIFGLSLKNKTD